MYHHLLKKAENTRYQGNGIVTYTEDFESQLKWLSDNGFASVTPAQVEAFLYNGQALPCLLYTSTVVNATKTEAVLLRFTGSRKYAVTPVSYTHLVSDQ